MRNLDESRRFDREVDREFDREVDKEPIGREPVERKAEVVPFEQRTTSPAPAEQTPLFPKGEVDQLQSRWDSIQAGFVDEPRKTLEEADKFVASAIERVSHLYSDERGKLEGMWRRGDQVSTEDLRIALQRYRTFFSRLTSM